MIITLIPFDKDNPIDISGRYLVETESISLLKIKRYIEAPCYRQLNKKTGKFQTHVGVNNQIVLKISTLPITSF